MNYKEEKNYVDEIINALCNVTDKVLNSKKLINVESKQIICAIA